MENGSFLLFQRRGGHNNTESVGNTLYDFLHASSVGSVHNLGYEDSFLLGNVDNFVDNSEKKEYAFLQYDASMVLDRDDAHIVYTNKNLFPGGPEFNSVHNIPVEKICDIDGQNCDTSDVFWKYVGKHWFYSAMCDASLDKRNSYMGDYGYCTNGLIYEDASAGFGNRSGYDEIKLWNYGSYTSKNFAEKLFLKTSDTILSEKKEVEDSAPIGTAIGNLSTHGISGNYRYSLDASQEDNASFTLDGNTLKINVVPNHATKNIYKVRLKTTDENGGTFDNIFEIKVKEPTIKPSVTLNPVPNIINTANVSVYPISGTCTDGAGDVPVAVGTVSKIIACNGGNFSDTVDVSGVSDGNVTIDASQSWGTKVGNAPQVSVQKDASKPTIAGTQSVTLTVGSADAINYDVKTGITAQDGSTDLTNALNCSVNPNYDANVVGDYTVTCTVEDAFQNVSETFTRTIKIVAVDKAPLEAKIQSAKDARDNPATVNDVNKTNLDNKITEAETALTNPNLTEAERDNLINALMDLIAKLKTDTDAPVFAGEPNLDYKVGSPEALSLVSSQIVGITVTDTIDGAVTPNCTTTPNYDANAVGTYTVNCSATDSQNNTSHFTRTITISAIDKTPLQNKFDEAKTKIADVKVVNNQAKTALQNKINEVENALNNQNLTETERNKLTAELDDLMGKLVRDTIPPLFNPTRPTKIISRKGNPINLNDVTADDGVGTSGIHPDGIQITVPPELDVNNPAKGNYTVNYTVSDNAGNTSSEDREVEITDADDLVNEVGKVTPAVLNGKTPDSVKQVEDAKKEAEDVINNPISTQKEIDDALKKLQEAIAGLVAPVVHAPAISGGGYNTHPVRPSSGPSSQTESPAPIIADSVPTEQSKEQHLDPHTLFNPSFEGACHKPTHLSTIHQDIEVTEEFMIAHKMLYNYQLTRWQGDADFRPYHYLTREEASRFMVEFAQNVLCRKKTRTYDDRFVDIAGANPTLVPFIKDSYEYEIFNGDKSDTPYTTFRPQDRLSEDELVAIIVRLITNEILEEGSGEDWATPYKSRLMRYTKHTEFFNSQRGAVAEMIYDVYRNNDYIKKDVGYIVTKRKQ